MKIAFYKGKGDWLDRLIRWGTASKYSHCEIIVGHNTCFGSSYRDGGVRTKIINVNNGNWEIVEVDAPEYLLNIIMENQVGTKYDLTGILFMQILGIDYHDDEKRFCSELIGYILGYTDPHRYSPGDLYNKIKDVYKVK